MRSGGSIGELRGVVAKNDGHCIKNLNKIGMNRYRSYLKCRMCDENLKFWERCEKYKRLKSERKIQSEATKIFDQFIATDAPCELNLCQKIREITFQNLNQPNQDTFIEAQDEIYKMMKNDSFIRFMSTTTVLEKEAFFAKPN